MKKKNLIINTALMVLFLFALILLGNETYAATTKTYTISSTITGTLDSQGVLTISGKGEMPQYGSNNIPWKDDNVKKLIIKSGITNVGYQNFADCTALESIELSNTITSIDQGAFAYCTSLNNVTLPSSIKKICKGAFAYCSNLTNITLNEGLENIEIYAFQNTKIKNLEIPSTLKDIELDVFFGVTTIESFSVRNGNNDIFYTDKGVLYNHMYNQEQGTFYNNKQLVCYPVANTMKNYKILDGTTDVSQNAFKNALNLQQVTFPNSIVRISSGAFSNTGLTSVTIPQVKLTGWGPGVFQNNKYLKTVNFNADMELVIFKRS